MNLIFDCDPSVILEWLIFQPIYFFQFLFGLLCPLFYLDFYIFFSFCTSKTYSSLFKSEDSYFIRTQIVCKIRYVCKSHGLCFYVIARACLTIKWEGVRIRYILVTVTLSGILKAKQKLGVTFKFYKQDVINFMKFLKMTMCRASETNSEK